MESNVLQKRWVQGRNVVVDDLRGTAFTGENGAHTFRVIGVDSAQETVAITGTITGRFLTATNVTVPLTGSVSDGVASLTLTEDCYVIPGRFVLSIYATNGSTTQCIYCAVGNVFRTQSDIIEYPSASIPDIEQIIADAQAAVTQINADVAAAQAAVAAAQTAVDGIEDQRQTMIASIASVAGQGTDTTLTQSGVAADAKAAGDQVSALKSAIDEIAIFKNNLFDVTGAEVGAKLTQYAVTTASTTLSVTNYIPITKGVQYNIGFPYLTERLSFYQKADTTEPAVVSNDWIAGRTPSDIASLVDWFTVNADDTCTFTVPADYIDVHNRTINYMRFTYATADVNKIFACQGTYIPQTHVIAPVPYIDAQLEEIGIPDKSTVLCYGDSLTMGTAGADKTYPVYLKTLLGENYTVSNYGVGGETAQQIAGRQGGVPLMVQPNTFPVNTYVAADIDSWFGSDIGKLYVQSGEGKNPATLGGVPVSLYFDSDTTTIRNNSSSALNITQPTPLIPYSATLRNKTMIAWMGTNGWGDSDVDTLLHMYQRMVEYNGNDNYIILGIITGGNLDTFLNGESKFVQAFGYHYIKLHDYMLHYGLADAGITPTAEDEQRIANGLVPTSLLSDSIHLNATGYELVANQVFKRGQELGLW